MKTTVDIPAKELEDLLQFTGAVTKKDAIVAAVTDFNRRRRMAELVKYAGTCDRFMTHEELMLLRETDRPLAAAPSARAEKLAAADAADGGLLR